MNAMARQEYPTERHAALPQSLPSALITLCPFCCFLLLLLLLLLFFRFWSAANVFHFARFLEFWKQYRGTAVEAAPPLDHM